MGPPFQLPTSHGRKMELSKLLYSQHLGGQSSGQVFCDNAAIQGRERPVRDIRGLATSSFVSLVRMDYFHINVNIQSFTVSELLAF
jgi:hypothetical protein